MITPRVSALLFVMIFVSVVVMGGVVRVGIALSICRANNLQLLSG